MVNKLVSAGLALILVIAGACGEREGSGAELAGKGDGYQGAPEVHTRDCAVGDLAPEVFCEGAACQRALESCSADEDLVCFTWPVETGSCDVMFVRKDQPVKPAPAAAPASPAVDPKAPETDGACRYGTATHCLTDYVYCPLSQPDCVGAACYCDSAYGPHWGYVRAP